MESNRSFRNRRTRRQSARQNRTGKKMVDLVQLMRRRYRPYVVNSFTRSSTETINSTSFNSNRRENLRLYNNNVYREMSDIVQYSLQRQDVSTNTEYPCCPASVLYRNQAPNNSSSGEIPTSREKPQSTVENVEEKATVATSNTKEVEEVGSRYSDLTVESPASSSNQQHPKEQSSKTESAALSSNMTDEHDQLSHNGSLAEAVDTSEESFESSTYYRIRYIQLHQNIVDPMENIQPSPSTSNGDAKAGGDGHHNDSVIQFHFTVTGAVIDVDTDDNQDSSEQEGSSDDESNEVVINVSVEERNADGLTD